MMIVLGRELVSPFGEFWRALGKEIDVPVEYIETGHSIVFEDQGADRTAPEPPAWSTIPDDDLAYHVAHQLTHMIMRKRGYPHTASGSEYPPDSAERRIGGDLEEMVLHASLESILRPYGFRKPFIVERMLRGAMHGVASAPVPDYGTPWHFTWAIRYCELKLDLNKDQWEPLGELYESRAPDVVALGEELRAIMLSVGWGTREQALEVMVRVRDTLGLGVDDRVLVVDPLTGKLV
jgi:hypothetical protein